MRQAESQDSFRQGKHVRNRRRKSGKECNTNSIINKRQRKQLRRRNVRDTIFLLYWFSICLTNKAILLLFPAPYLRPFFLFRKRKNMWASFSFATIKVSSSFDVITRNDDDDGGDGTPLSSSIPLSHLLTMIFTMKVGCFHCRYDKSFGWLSNADGNTSSS